MFVVPDVWLMPEPVLLTTAGFLWLAGALTVLRAVVVPGALLLTAVPDVFLVIVLLPLTVEPLGEVVEPLLMVDVPAVLVAVVLLLEAVLETVPAARPDTPLTVEPPLSEVLPANTLFEPV